MADNGSPDGDDMVTELLTTLSDPVRREVIRYFETVSAESTTSLEELVAHIEPRTASKSSDELWTNLYQIHLPTLQAKGWLEFDTEQHVVTYQGHQEAEQVLQALSDMFAK